METNRLNEAIDALATYQAKQELYELIKKFIEILPYHLRHIRIKGTKENGQEFDFSLKNTFSSDSLIGSEILKQLKKEYADNIIKDILSKAGYEASNIFNV